MRRIVTLCVLALAVAVGMLAGQEGTGPPTAGQAEEVLNRMLEALGGEKFLSAKDIIRRGRLYSFNRGELSSPGERFVDYLKFPGKKRLELGKDGKIVYLNDNDQGWELDRQGIREMTPEQIENFQESNRRDYEYLLRFRPRGEKVEVYYLGREFADNRRVHVLELVDERGDSSKLLVDARTYLPMQLRYRERDVLSGEWVAVTEYFGKFYFHAKERKPGDVLGFKLDQHIYIAIGAKIVPQDRSEKRELADVMALAEIRNLILGYSDLIVLHSLFPTPHFCSTFNHTPSFRGIVTTNSFSVSSNCTSL